MLSSSDTNRLFLNVIAQKSDITQACNKCDCRGISVSACVSVCAHVRTDAAFSCVWSSAQPLYTVTVLVLHHSLVVPYQTTVAVLRVYFHWYA